MPGLFGSSPFDDEGVASRRTVVIERGVLKSYLLNTYTARKLGLKTTGNARAGSPATRASAREISIIEAGETAPEEIIAGFAERVVRDRADRRGGEYRHRRLFVGRGGPVD